MPMLTNRRAERQARALLTQSQALVNRASAHLREGDALAAMRTLRTAQQLSDLDSRLRVKRQVESQQRHDLEAAQRQLRARAADLDHLEQVLRAEEERLRHERESLKRTAATLDALYKMLYENPGEDGPAAAMGEGVGLTQPQLNTGCSDGTTKLPTGMTVPVCRNNQ
jgi:hypothetical protein